MRFIVYVIFFTSVALAYSQNKFVFNENGLVPKHITTHIGSLAKNKIQEKTLEWIKANYKNPDSIINDLNKNNFILITGIKNNVVHESKLYYHMKYKIKISFDTGKYKFEPLKVQSKLNSKYDMGWIDFNLNNGALFFKKGNAIKKTKSYVTDIPAVLNELNTNLYNYLIKENSN